MTRVRLGISTCPNDTFAFHALMAREVAWRGLEFEVELADVEVLNQRFAAGELDVAKVSFSAALDLRDQLLVLPTGSALGFGVGPLVLAARGRDFGGNGPLGPFGPRADGGAPRVLLPGEHTTATLLWRAFHPHVADETQVVFSKILPALREAHAELGVCIHEARFTWKEQELVFVEDLGATWERETRCALPLGGIVGRRALGTPLLERVQAVIADSLDWAHAHREQTLPTLAAHAQELAPEILWAHVELYVNAWTRELGETGRAALAALEERYDAVRGETRSHHLEVLG